MHRKHSNSETILHIIQTFDPKRESSHRPQAHQSHTLSLRHQCSQKIFATTLFSKINNNYF